MNIFVLVAIVILACLACIGLALWYRKRRLDKMVENFDDPNDFNPERRRGLLM